MASKVVEQEVQENEIDLFGALVEGADPEDMLDALLDAMDAEDGAPEVQEGWKTKLAAGALGAAAGVAGLHQLGKTDVSGQNVSGTGARIAMGAKKLASAPGRFLRNRNDPTYREAMLDAAAKAKPKAVPAYEGKQ